MTTQTQSIPTGIDWDKLETAVEKPKNKKQIIVDYINANGIPAAAQAPTLFAPNGTVIQDSFENYLGNQNFYSTGSFAKLANGTPLDFQYDTTDGLKAEIEKYKDRSSFDLGSFVHEAILEPHRWDTVVCEPQASRASHEGCDRLIDFWAQYVQVPSMPSTKLDDKKAIIAHMQEASGMRSIDMKNALIVQRLHERWSQYESGLWASILGAGNREVSMYCDDFNGLHVKIRPDGILYENQIGVNAIVSVKTTSETTIGGYARQFVRLGYDVKEAAYQRIASHITGLDFSTTIMVVLSTAEPFNVGVFILNDNELGFAWQRFMGAFDLAKTCIQMNEFPGWNGQAYSGQFGLIDLDVY